MSVKGKQKEQKEFVKELFVGFASVQIVAINPSRTELNKLLSREPKEDDKEFEYVAVDNDGNDKVRLSFWLFDEKDNKYFVHSFNLTKRDRKNKDGDKVQLINSTCTTSWVPYLPDSTEPDASVVLDWFVQFQNKEKEVLGDKKWRKALSGEEELGTLIRSWLGRMNFQDPDTEVFVDTAALLKGNYAELRSLIGGEYDTPFVALLGVQTDENDKTKKYQHVYGKSFLPNGFMKYINNGNKFPSDATKKMWKRFQEEAEGQYGFNGYTELVPLVEYDEKKDISGSDKTKSTPAPASSEY